MNLPDPIRCTVGIDYALEADHALSLRRHGEAPEPVRRIPATRPAVRGFFEALLAGLPAGSLVAVAVEGSGRQLIGLLETIGGVVVHPVNPLASQMARRARHVSGIKSDPVDARVLRAFLEQNLGELPAHTPLDAASAELQTLCVNRRHLVGQRGKAGNILLDALRHDLPALVKAFGGYGTTLARLLVRWPELQGLRRARRGTLEAFLRKSGRFGEARREAILAAIAAADPAATGLMWGYAAVQAKVALLLEEQIKLLEARIAEAYRAHPLHDVVASFPRTGANLGPRFCALLGADHAARWTPEHLRRIAGVAPVTLESGTSRKTTVRRRACRTFDMQTLVEHARCSTQEPGWAREFYRVKRASGKSPHTVYRMIAHKWIAIILRCAESRQPYNPTKFKSPYNTQQPDEDLATACQQSKNET